MIIANPIYDVVFKYLLDDVEIARELLSALKVERKYINAATHTEVEANHEFIKKLTHESYVIQVNRLNKGHRNELEDILEVFSQENFVHNKQQIDFQKSLDNPLVNKMVRRLSKAAADEEVRRTMEGEDHLDRLLSQQSSEEKAEYEAQLKEKDLIIETVEKQLEVERAAKADTENQNAILLAKIKAMEDAELKRHAKE